jgi:hypothetical protein
MCLFGFLQTVLKASTLGGGTMMNRGKGVQKFLDLAFPLRIICGFLILECPQRTGARMDKKGPGRFRNGGRVDPAGSGESVEIGKQKL